jgi:hypothetical protein
MRLAAIAGAARLKRLDQRATDPYQGDGRDAGEHLTE